MARELITDASGKVTAVSYIDKTTGEERAGALPDRRAFGSGVRVGAAAAQLEVVAASATGSRNASGSRRQVPHRHGRLRHVSDGAVHARHADLQLATATAPHLYIPWWMADRHKQLDFPLGYHVEVGGGGFGMPHLGFGAAAYDGERRLRAADETSDS